MTRAQLTAMGWPQEFSDHTTFMPHTKLTPEKQLVLCVDAICEAECVAVLRRRKMTRAEMREVLAPFFGLPSPTPNSSMCHVQPAALRR